MRLTVPALALTAALVGCPDPVVEVQPPDAPTLAIEPAEPTTTDPITVVVTDPQSGGVTSYTYAWTKDGQAVPDATATTVDAALTAKGEAWEVTVTPFNGDVAGTPASASVTIGNTAPTLSLAWAADPVFSTDPITVVPTTDDADGDTVSVRYTWTRDGERTGSTSATISAEQTERDQVWEVTAIANDGSADSDPVVLSILVANAPPRVTGVALAPTTAYASSTLTATAAGFEDDDGDSVVAQWTWFVNGTALDSADAATLSGRFVRGDVVEVEATPDDGFDLGDPVRSNAVTILNGPPTAPGLTITPAEPKATVDPVQCRVSSPSLDADGDAITYRMSWTIDGTAVTGTTTTVHEGDTLPASVTVPGEAVCTATPNDGIEDGTPATAKVDIRSLIERATCETMVTERDTWGRTAKGVDLRAWTNDTLIFMGCITDGCAPSEFYCREDSRSETLEFGVNGLTLRAAVDPERAFVGTWPDSTHFTGCCSKALGMCNAFDSNNNGVDLDPADVLCRALGYESGEIVRESTVNSCPEIHVDDDAGQEWTTDFVNSSGYGSDYRCTGYL
jgi:hypothetical protein